MTAYRIIAQHGRTLDTLQRIVYAHCPDQAYGKVRRGLERIGYRITTVVRA